MSSKIDELLKETEETKNDWDDEEDSWDDWGDAEDKPQSQDQNSIQTHQSTTNSSSSLTTSTNAKNKTDNSQTNEKRSDPERKVEQPETSKSSWGIWGSKFSSVLSTATEGLGSLTTSVSQTLDQVIGVPDPEKLARLNADLEAKSQANSPSEDSPKEKDQERQESRHESVASGGSVPVFGLNLVSGVTNLGSKVLNTGLDTLEGIGKKTMDLLQENDPLLKNKRKFLGLDPEKPNLSEVLKEAKRDAETLENTLKELKLEKTKASLRFEILFENFCGLVHYEALEILSKESKIKIESLLESVSGKALEDLKETLEEVKELSELEDTEGESEGEYEADDLNGRLNTAIADMDLTIHFNEITKNWTETLEWLEKEAPVALTQDAFAKGITTLAELCSLEMNKLHKIAELLLIKDHHSTANEVDGLIQLCKQFNAHLSGHTTRYAAILSHRNDDREAKTLVTTLFAELQVAMEHINKAFKLFLPILQLGAV